MDQPASSLTELIKEVIDRKGYQSLSEMARHTSIPYQTLWAWQRGTRNLKRPPAPVVLDTFAADFGISRAVVFRAAGRSYPDPKALDPEIIEFVEAFEQIPQAERPEALKVLHLYRELPEGDRGVVTRLMRDLAARR